jgi:hypothetical protein
VVSTAIENQSEVTVGFLVNYLHNFFLISQRNQQSGSGGSNRDLTKEQRESLVNLLEEKLKANESNVKGINSSMALGLSRILIRNPKQEVIRETLASSLKTQARKLNFEELHSSLYALKQAYNIDKNAKDEGLQAKYKQAELDVLQQLKEGGAKTKNLRILAERLFQVENSFKGNAEA